MKLTVDNIFIINMEALGLTQQLSSYIIRPPRASYSLEDLGQSIFEYKGIIYQRIDFQVAPSANNVKLQASIYLDKFNKNKPRPTLIYLHANSSSRISVKNYLKHVIEHFDVVCFDFRGCGLSQGNYLTLGFLEKHDVKAIVDQVDKRFGNRRYLIWGRSMGAVTAIMYISKFIKNSDKVASLVLDSPFADLQKVIYFLGDKKLPLVPKFMIESVIQSLEDHVKQKIAKQYKKLFLIRKHKPIQQITAIRIPIFFIGSKSDELVDCKQVQQMYDNAFCHKQLELLQGGHNQIRPQHLKLAVVEFLLASLTMKNQNIPRKKIFSYGSNRNSIQQNQKHSEHNELMINIKNQDNLQKKSKSKPRTRLFRANTFNQSPVKIKKTKSQLTNESYVNEQAKKQTQATHIQILNKVLPQNSTRRAKRIFQNLKINKQE